LYFVLTKYAIAEYPNAELVFFDVSVSIFSVYATFLTSKKILENWHYWIVIDLVSSFVFWYKGLEFTSALYAVYVFFAFKGLKEWQISMSQSRDLQVTKL
jgi:nicotinamide mononucleotide transporter